MLPLSYSLPPSSFTYFFTNPFQTPMPGGSGESNQEKALTECEAGANRAIFSKKTEFSKKWQKPYHPKHRFRLFLSPTNEIAEKFSKFK